MALSIGIVGLPNVGKSTLFNALTRNEVLAANYPFATIDPNVGVVAVPDPRLDRLAELFESKEVVPATVTFVDIAGIVKGASEGEGLGNKFLAAIRESDAICQVVRVFTDPDVIHVDGRIDPADDIATINTELMLADLQTIDSRLVKLAKEARKQPDLAPAVREAEKAREILDAGRTIATAVAAGEVKAELLADLHLLSAKPFIYVFNVDEGALDDEGLRPSSRHWWPRPSRWSCAPRSRRKWHPSTPRTRPNCWPATAKTSRDWCSSSTWGSPLSACRRS